MPNYGCDLCKPRHTEYINVMYLAICVHYNQNYVRDLSQALPLQTMFIIIVQWQERIIIKTLQCMFTIFYCSCNL